MKISKKDMQSIIFGELPGYELIDLQFVDQLFDYKDGEVVGGAIIRQLKFKYNYKKYYILVLDIDGYTPSLRLYPYDYVVAKEYE